MTDTPKSTELIGTTGEEIASKLGPGWVFKLTERPTDGVSNVLWCFTKTYRGFELIVSVSTAGVVLLLREYLEVSAKAKSEGIRMHEAAVIRRFKRAGSIEDDVRLALRTAKGDLLDWQEMLLHALEPA